MSHRTISTFIFVCTTLALSLRVEAQPNSKPVAGKADVLRAVPKKFATLVKAHGNAKVDLLLEGDKEATTWSINPDAEIKIHGWWGRLDQLKEKQRLWVWFDVDRSKKPVSILMIADLDSEKDIHNQHRGEAVTKFEKARAKQRDYLRGLWREKGLPGSVLFTHKLSGEMEVMLDHEAMRWGRYLKNGDKVTLKADGDIKATVKLVRPWRERTQIRLVTNSGHDQTGLKPGQRIHLRVPEPPKEVQASDLPTDLDRITEREARMEWFLASIYCTCKVPGDRCTGMFYSLASCNVNSCGMPRKMSTRIGKLMDEGKSDKEILAILKKERGSELLKPHLLK